MVACSYQITLLVLNVESHSFAVERTLIFTRARVLLFIYHCYLITV